MRDRRDFCSIEAVDFVRNQLRQHGDVQVVLLQSSALCLWDHFHQHAMTMLFITYLLQLASEALAQGALVLTLTRWISFQDCKHTSSDNRLLVLAGSSLAGQHKHRHRWFRVSKRIQYLLHVISTLISMLLSKLGWLCAGVWIGKACRHSSNSRMYFWRYYRRWPPSASCRLEFGYHLIYLCERLNYHEICTYRT